VRKLLQEIRDGWVDADLYLAIRPMLAVSDGALWLMSTPHGKASSMTPGKTAAPIRNGFASPLPALPPNFSMRNAKPWATAGSAMEYLCEFTDSGYSIFDRDLVEGAISYHVKPSNSKGSLWVLWANPAFSPN
jgi:hypothetical protein